MSETENLAKMSESLSKDIFEQFRWVEVGSRNKNWKCEDPTHKKKTHPADIVFYYEDPYSNKLVYFHCDLKSYAEATVETADFSKTIESLSMQVNCAEKSEEWQKAYLLQNNNVSINGLLFVYNHDGEYDKNFYSKIAQIRSKDLFLPRNNKIYIINPSDIYWLNNVVHHIAWSNGKKYIADDYSFFYPQKTKHSTTGKSKVATIEMILSPWIILHNEKDNNNIFNVYYRRTGACENEFIYLFDYFRHNGFMDKSTNEIIIHCLEPDDAAFSIFDKSKQSYLGIVNISNPTLKDIIQKIKLLKMADVIKIFSTDEIGMGQR